MFTRIAGNKNDYVISTKEIVFITKFQKKTHISGQNLLITREAYKDSTGKSYEDGLETIFYIRIRLKEDNYIDLDFLSENERDDIYTKVSSRLMNKS